MAFPSAYLSIVIFSISVLISTKLSTADSQFRSLLSTDELTSCPGCAQDRAASAQLDSTYFPQHSSIKRIPLFRRRAPRARRFHAAPYSSDITIIFYSEMENEGISLNDILASLSFEIVVEIPSDYTLKNLRPKPICTILNVGGICAKVGITDKKTGCVDYFNQKRGPEGHFLLQTVAQFELIGKKTKYAMVIEKTFQRIRNQFPGFGYERKGYEMSHRTVAKFSFLHKKYTSE